MCKVSPPSLGWNPSKEKGETPLQGTNGIVNSYHVKMGDFPDGFESVLRINWVEMGQGVEAVSDKPYHIVLVDDHVLLREGIKMVLSERDNWKIVGEAGDGLQLLHLLRRLSPHMVILDISLPTLGGIETTRRIKTLYPGIKVLVLTMHKDPQFLRDALWAGAEGYLLKEEAYTELFSAIESIQEGNLYISPRLGGLEGQLPFKGQNG